MPPIYIIVIFTIYWGVVLIHALIPPGPVYKEGEDDGYGSYSRHLVTPGLGFSAKNRIAITLICLVALAISFLFWEELVSFLKPTLAFIFGQLALYGIVFTFCCFTAILFPFWLMLVYGGTYLLFMFLPSKMIQWLGLALSGGPE